jgi:hypothetical protein
VAATILSFFDKTRVFSRKVRGLISDYALAIAVFIAIVASYTKNADVAVDRLSLPRNYAPTSVPTLSCYA